MDGVGLGLDPSETMGAFSSSFAVQFMGTKGAMSSTISGSGAVLGLPVRLGELTVRVRCLGRAGDTRGREEGLHRRVDSCLKRVKLEPPSAGTKGTSHPDLCEAGLSFRRLLPLRLVPRREDDPVSDPSAVGAAEGSGDPGLELMKSTQLFTPVMTPPNS